MAGRPLTPTQEAIREDLTELFERHQKLIHETADKFARTYNRGREDCRADAYYHFIEAVRRFDPAKSPNLEARIASVIWFRLLSKVRRYATRRAKMSMQQFNPRSEELVFSIRDPEPWDTAEFCSDLSADAAELIRTIFDCDEVTEAIRTASDHPHNPEARIMHRVRDHLKGTLTWSRERINEAIAEIREVI